ncbi:hypothetical protein L1887_21370 [Cichorium endivia]|nr:hypothetical protein L1887_21370 [Cichorium endivia]
METETENGNRIRNIKIAASIVLFKVESDVVPLDGHDFLETDAEIGNDGKLHVTVRKSNGSRRSLGLGSLPGMTPRWSNLTGAEIYSLSSSRNQTPRGSNFNHSDFYSMMGFLVAGYLISLTALTAFDAGSGGNRQQPRASGGGCGEEEVLLVKSAIDLLDFSGEMVGCRLSTKAMKGSRSSDEDPFVTISYGQTVKSAYKSHVLLFLNRVPFFISFNLAFVLLQSRPFPHSNHHSVCFTISRFDSNSALAVYTRSQAISGGYFMIVSGASIINLQKLVLTLMVVELCYKEEQILSEDLVHQGLITNSSTP